MKDASEAGTSSAGREAVMTQWMLFFSVISLSARKKRSNAATSSPQIFSALSMKSNFIVLIKVTILFYH